MIARHSASTGKQLPAVFAEVGTLQPGRENFRLTAEVEQTFTDKLRTDPDDFSGSRVARVVRIDGLTLVPADGSSVLSVPGTERVARVYSEARAGKSSQS
ncbi:MAG: hypothetical protein ABSD39_18145 [Terriglobales bacterium]|jgi:phosphomannomutase